MLSLREPLMTSGLNQFVATFPSPCKFALERNVSDEGLLFCYMIGGI